MTNEEKIIAICADVIGVDASELSIDTVCEEQGDFDSLAIVMIIAEMSEVFEKNISNNLSDIKIEKISDFLKLLD